MLPSTFAALRTQGIDPEPLRQACLRCFSATSFTDPQAQDRFWREFIACRRAFREATGAAPEDVLA